MAVVKHVIVVLAVYLPVLSAGQGEGSKCRGISRGKEFVIGFTSNYQLTGIGELHITVVAFSDNPTTVTISSSYQVSGDEKYQVTFELPPRGYRRITVPIQFRLENESIRSDRVLSVVASSDVTVYGANYESYSTDAFLSLPTDQLGLHHVVSTVRTSQSPGGNSLLAVIGLTDDTDVHVTLTTAASFEGQDYDAGDVLTFVVGRHEIVQVLSDRGTDLSGTIIRSDRPVAAIAGHQCAATRGSTCDSLMEQLIPVDSWGTSHIFTATGRQVDTSIYKIVAFFDGTIVSVPGMGNLSLNAGGFQEVSMSGSGVISSTLPSSVMQTLRYIEGVLVDPSIIQVPSEEQFAFKFGFATPPESTQDSSGFFNFANIVVKADECHMVVMNGQRVKCDGAAVDIPGTEYVVLTQRLDKSEGVYFIEGSSSPMSVIVYGYENDETYGFAAGLSLPKEGRLLSVTPFIVSENGGGILTTTLPCLEQNIPTSTNVTCRFTSSGQSIIRDGVLTDFYRVRCPTYIFGHTGFTSLDVSLDGGETFPYSDRIYVAPQDDLPSKVNVSGLTSDFPFLDLTGGDANFTIVWDPSDFPNTTHVNLTIFFEDPRGGSSWNERIPLESQVPNTGMRMIRASTIYMAARQGVRSTRDVKGFIKAITGVFIDVVSAAVDIVEDVAENIKEFVEDAFVEAHFKTTYFLMWVTDELDCRDWDDVLQEGYKRLRGLPGCPPTMRVAERDRERYTKSNAGIDIYHPGVADCYRRENGENGAGTQCCYDARGELVIGPPGGGTADAYPSGTRNHVKYDVEPWIACCHVSGIGSDDCKKYYKYRPPIGPQRSNISLPYDPPRRARATGDPHFTTLDQLEYTFNPAGEFILLQSDLHNVMFQGRIEQIPGLNASVFTAFVLQAESMPKIQIQRSSQNRPLVLLDDKELQLAYDGVALPKFKLEAEAEFQLSPDQTELVVRLSSLIAISFTLLPEMISYTVNIDEKFRGQTRGLLGNFNGDPDDDLTLPNGDVLAINSTLREIHYDFGLKWAVNKSGSIFRYMQSEDFESFNRPDFAPSFDLPDPDDISEEIIETCGSSLPCLYDAVNTGSLSFANSTLSDFREYHEASEIFREIVVCDFPTDFANGKMETVVYYVNSSYTFQCEDGFTLVGDATGYCGEGGVWTTRIPSCFKTCDPPSELLDGGGSGTIYFANRSYTFQCEDGFTLVGDATGYCGEGGVWTTEIPSCFKTCDPPSEFVDGGGSGSLYFANRSYTFQCGQGLFPWGDQTVSCDEMGNWFGDFPDCVSLWLVVGLAVAALVVIALLLLLVIFVRKMCRSGKSVV